MKNKSLLTIILIFAASSFSWGIELVSPVNNFNAPSFTVNFNWNPVTSQSGYKLQIAQDAAFTTIINEYNVTQTNMQVSFPSTATTVYWKVSTIGNNGFIESNTYSLNFINPSQNPNLLLWLSADSNVVINPDSTISAWNNIIPNGINAIQPVSGKQPRLTTNVSQLNKKNVVRFDGLNDELFTSTGGLVGGLYTIFNYSGGATFNNYNGFITNRSITVFDDYYITAALPGGTNFEPNDYFGTQGGTQKGKMFINQSPFPFTSTGYSLAPLNMYKIFAGIRIVTIKSGIFNIGNEVGTNRYWQGDTPEIIFSKTNSETEADSMQTYLHNKYAPPITIRDTVIGTSFCSTVSIKAPDNYVSYLWSTGATTPSVNVTPNDVYSVKGKDVFGTETTTTFNVFPYVRLNNDTVIICRGDTFKIDLKTPANFTAEWNTGLNSTKINITTAGRYIVTIKDATGICSVNDTINVIVDKPQLLPTPDVSDSLRICLNEKLFLNTQTSFDSIRWSTGSTDNFIPITASGNYNVYGKTMAGCIINQPFYVRITGSAPTANFTFSPACDSSQTLFTDVSISNSGNITNWQWTFGDGNTSILQNPANIYTAPTNFSVGLKITTNQGCSDSISKVVKVNRRPIASFGIRQACERNPTLFQSSGNAVANAASITNWLWDFDGLGSSILQDPFFEFPTANTYNVKLTVTNSNGCVNDVIIPTKINQSPVANFSFDAVCGKTPVNFRFLTIVPPSTIFPDNITWRWSFGDNTSEASIKDAVHPYATPGTYDVMLAVASKEGGCPDTIVKQVKVYDFPIVDFAVSATQCAGKDIAFTDISQTPDGTPITKWKWFFSGQSTDTLQNTSYNFATEGNYTIQLTATNEVGCSNTKLRSIAVSALPTSQFTFSPQNGLPPLIVNYTNQSPTNGNYVWDYGDGSPLVAGYNPPTHTYNTKGSYPIKLIATNFRGCTDTLTKFILVDKAYLDGIITSITITPIGDYYQIQATILNGSNVEIRNLGLNLQVGSGSVIRENWTGSLLPGQTAVYNFNAEIKIGENSIPVVCASIDNVNSNAPEDKTDNNTTCKEVRVGSFDVLNVFPNPTYETINFGVMLPKDGRVSIGFVDILGQTLFKKDFDGVRGYNNLSMNTSVLNAAVYVAVVTFDGQTIREKFIRKDRK